MTLGVELCIPFYNLHTYHAGERLRYFLRLSAYIINNQEAGRVEAEIIILDEELVIGRRR